jgi:hypothetical protein
MEKWRDGHPYNPAQRFRLSRVMIRRDSRRENMCLTASGLGRIFPERNGLIPGKQRVSLEKGAASKGGPARYQTPIEAACADRRIERYSFSRDHPVL